MPDPVFLDKSQHPQENELNTTLASANDLWQDIKNFIENEFGTTKEEWKFYMKSTGWQLKTLLKKRNLFFFTPYHNSFLITFVFGDKAVTEVEKSNLPKSIIEEMLNARKYMEGRGFSILVADASTVELVKKLLRIKVNN